MTELRDQIARAIAEADGRYVDYVPLGDATYEQMADVALGLAAPAIQAGMVEDLHQMSDNLARVQRERDAARADLETVQLLLVAAQLEASHTRESRRGWAEEAAEMTVQRDLAVRQRDEQLAGTVRLPEYWRDDLTEQVQEFGVGAAVALVESWIASTADARPSMPTCSCSRFADTGGVRVADLCCPIHGIDAGGPHDGPWVTDEEDGPTPKDLQATPEFGETAADVGITKDERDVFYRAATGREPDPEPTVSDTQPTPCGQVTDIPASLPDRRCDPCREDGCLDTVRCVEHQEWVNAQLPAWLRGDAADEIVRYVLGARTLADAHDGLGLARLAEDVKEILAARAQSGTP